MGDKQGRSHVGYLEISYGHTSHISGSDKDVDGLQTTGWESHKIDFYTFGSQNVYVLGPSMVGQDWAILKLNKTAWLAVSEATQPTLQGNQCSGAQMFSQLQMSFLTNKAARQWKTGSELKLRKGSSKYSERPLACLPTAGLPSFCFHRASLQPSIISSSEKTQSVRRGDGGEDRHRNLAQGTALLPALREDGKTHDTLPRSFQQVLDLHLL